MNEDFKDAPVSITEHKAHKNRNGTLWTPRDCLVSLLRQIDSGEIDPDVVIVGFRFKTPGDDIYSTGFNVAYPDTDDALAVLKRVDYLFMRKVYGDDQ